MCGIQNKKNIPMVTYDLTNSVILPNYYITKKQQILFFWVRKLPLG